MIEVQFHAHGNETLIDAIRQAAAAEGAAWSRRKIAAWVAAGHARVDSEVTLDPQTMLAEGARVDLSFDPHPGGIGAAGYAPAAASLPVLHVDRHLLIIEILAGPAHAREGDTLDSDIRALLERLGLGKLGIGGLPPRIPFVTAPAGVAVTGLAAAALTEQAAEALEAAFASGEAWMEVHDLEGRLTPEDLVSRCRQEPGPDAAPLHVTRLRLPHPRDLRLVDLSLEA